MLSNLSKKIFFFFMHLLFFTSVVYGDGGVFIRDITKELYDILRIGTQIAEINYKDGYQNLKILINLHSDELYKFGKGTIVWIFPVPSNPENITIDIEKESRPWRLINYSPIDIKDIFYREFKTDLSSIYLFYTCTFPLIYFTYDYIRYYRALSSYSQSEDITIHHRIKKFNLVAELISTKNAESLYNYLKEKNLLLPHEAKPLMEEYVGKNYSFVIAWSDEEQETIYPKREFILSDINILYLSITFPTEKIYFPLKMTRIYGELKIPIRIHVGEYVRPNIYEKIKRFSKVKYLYDGSTLIEINTEAKNLMDDLWMIREKPLFVDIIENLQKNSTILLLFVFALSSMMSSLISGYLTLDIKRDKRHFINFSLMGLFNFSTIIGFTIASYYLIVKKSRLVDKNEKHKFLFFVIISFALLSVMLSLFYISIKSIIEFLSFT